MGMPCEVNSILKLNATSFPATIALGQTFTAVKSEYRIFPIDVPIQLVNTDWMAIADVVITRLVWEAAHTYVNYRIHRVYAQPFSLK